MQIRATIETVRPSHYLVLSFFRSRCFLYRRFHPGKQEALTVEGDEKTKRVQGIRGLGQAMPSAYAFPEIQRMEQAHNRDTAEGTREIVLCFKLPKAFSELLSTLAVDGNVEVD